MTHPDDETGDVPRRMEAKGEILTRPRNIGFNVVFTKRSSAEQFAQHLRDQSFTVSVDGSDIEGEFAWDVVVVKHMVPSHQEIEKFEIKRGLEVAP